MISELKVLRSNAGYYIGTTISEDDMDMPYSRDSACYYSSREQAQADLDSNDYPVKLTP